MSETMPMKCIKEYASKSDLLHVTSLTSMVVNLAITERGLEPSDTTTLWYRLMYADNSFISRTRHNLNLNFDKD